MGIWIINCDAVKIPGDLTIKLSGCGGKMMKKKLILIFTVIVMPGCVTTHDPTLASGVERKGSGIYTVNGMGFRGPL